MRQVIRDLERLRRRSRAMLVLQRSCQVAAWMLGALIAIIAIDYVLRFPGTVRLLILLAGLGLLGRAVWLRLLPAARFRPSLTQLALRAEAIMPGVAGRLASSVEFAAAGVDRENTLAARSVRETESRLAGERIDAVVRHGPTVRHGVVLIGLLAVIAAAGLASPSSLRIGLARTLLPLGETRWPARTAVESLMGEVVGASMVHPRGQVLSLRARNLTPRGADEDVVAVHRMRVDGAWTGWERLVLTHQGAGVHERLVDTHAEAVEVYFRTADNRTAVERIALVPPPEIIAASFLATPPAYASGRYPIIDVDLGPGLDERAVTERPALEGSDAILRLELNKPLPVPPGDRSLWLRRTLGWGDGPLPEFDPESSLRWTVRWRITETRTLAMELVDEHGLANAEPIAFRINAVEDRLPAVTMTRPQSDETVLPTAVIDLAAEAEDDVAVARLGLRAGVERGPDASLEEDVWRHEDDADAVRTAVESDLDLAPLALERGDVVLVHAFADDMFELDGRRHDTARSPARRLRVIDELELAQQLRRQLALVRQNVIRVEGQQAELQDDIIDAGLQPGVERGQAMIGERIAQQGEAMEELIERMQRNRLDDEQLRDLADQTRDLLDYAGRASGRAVEAIQERQADDPEAREGAETEGAEADARGRTEGAPVQPRQAAGPGGARPTEKGEPDRRADEEQPDADTETEGAPVQPRQAAGPGGARSTEEGEPDRRADEEQPDADTETEGAPVQPRQAAGPGGARPTEKGEPDRRADEEQPDADTETEGAPVQPRQAAGPGGARSTEEGAAGQRAEAEAEDEDEDEDDSPAPRDAAPEDREIVEHQQEVREELADLIELLDRDEDTWVVTKQLEGLLGEQQGLETETRELGEQTIGRDRSQLSERELTELERIEQLQRELAEEARQLIDEMRRRSEALEEADARAAAGMRNAADTAEERELDRNMEQAAERAAQNQLRSAASQQRAAGQTLERMLEEMQETKRAEAEELIRQLASLVESIERLVAVQENELIALARAIDGADFGGRDRAMIRLNQNTQAVAGEARAAGQEARRIARALDRAADAQGAAVAALRAQPPDGASARTAEERSLELLIEAKELAEALQEQAEEDAVRQQREALLEAYRGFLEREVTLRAETLPLTELEQLDRRRLVEARRFGSTQDEIRRGLDDLRSATRELADAVVFNHVHRLIDGWAAEAADALREGTVTTLVTDRQQLVVEGLGHIIEALEDLVSPPEEFTDQEQQAGGGQGGGQSGQQEVIPNLAQLRLLRGLQQLVNDQTRRLDERGDLESAARRTRLREVGEQQRDLLELGETMIEQFRRGEPEPDPEEEGGAQ